MKEDTAFCHLRRAMPAELTESPCLADLLTAAERLEATVLTSSECKPEEPGLRSRAQLQHNAWP